MTVSSIGQIVSRADVTNAAASTIAEWYLTYLPDVERQKGLVHGTLPRISSLTSIHGGLDHESWQADRFPEIIVVAQPFGDAERFGDGSFDQCYTLEISTTVLGESELEATMLADSYGAAIMATIAGNGSLGGFAERTRMQHAPETRFPDLDDRAVVQSVCRFWTFVQSVANEMTRPLVPVPDGQLPPDYTVETVDLTLQGVKLGIPFTH